MVRYSRGDDMTVNTDGIIKAISYGRVRQKAPWHSGRTLNANLFVYVDAGRLKMQVGKEAFSLKKGDILCVPENTFYRPLEASSLEYYFIHFSADTRPAETEGLGFRSNPMLKGGDYELSVWGGDPNVRLSPLTHCAENEAVREIFVKLSSLRLRTNTDKLLLDSLVRQLIITLSADSYSGKALSRNTVRITDYIDENYFEDISLTVLSESFGLSKSYIARLFKTELHTTSAEYLSRTRIAAACRLLGFSDMQIGEISEAVGFRDQYYFSRVFRKVCGTTPGEFRKRHKSV